MIKAVIFDMDGVLIDTEKLYNRFWCQASKEFGFDMTFEHALSIRSMSAEYAIPKLSSIFGRDFPYYDVKKRRIDIMEEYVNKYGVDAKKGVSEIIKYLKDNNYKCAIATSSDMYRTEKYLSMAGIGLDFDAIICGPEVEHSKPAPDIYITAANKLSLLTQECIAVEDSNNGILSAYNAGCRVVMVPDLSEPEEDMRKYLFGVAKTINEITYFLN